MFHSVAATTTSADRSTASPPVKPRRLTLITDCGADSKICRDIQRHSDRLHPTARQRTL